MTYIQLKLVVKIDSTSVTIDLDLRNLRQFISCINPTSFCLFKIYY